MRFYIGIFFSWPILDPSWRKKKTIYKHTRYFIKRPWWDNEVHRTEKLPIWSCCDINIMISICILTLTLPFHSVMSFNVFVDDWEIWFSWQYPYLLKIFTIYLYYSIHKDSMIVNSIIFVPLKDYWLYSLFHRGVSTKLNMPWKLWNKGQQLLPSSQILMLSLWLLRFVIASTTLNISYTNWLMIIQL